MLFVDVKLVDETVDSWGNWSRLKWIETCWGLAWRWRNSRKKFICAGLQNLTLRKDTLMIMLTTYHHRLVI